MKIVVTGAGGAPTEGVVRSLLESDLNLEIIGVGADKGDLALSRAHRKYLVPYANDENYQRELFKIIELERPIFIHAQNDNEVLKISKLRSLLDKQGVKTYLPRHEVIETCVSKWLSYKAFSEAGVKVPKTILIENHHDLEEAFDTLINKTGRLWLRSNSVGGGGTGALPTGDLNLAEAWISRFNGWGNFLAAELLSSASVTWLSLWQHGKLVVAQSRLRDGWVHGNRAPSGVTGVTKIGRTFSDIQVDKIALSTIQAVDTEPHGIYGVDMSYDIDGVPNPTEINIGRFFTTVYFFTKAGLNMPEIYTRIAVEANYQCDFGSMNPLPNNLLWVRGMDTEPKLLNAFDLDYRFQT